MCGPLGCGTASIYVSACDAAGGGGGGNAAGGGGWYTVVKHEYQKRDGKWLLTGGTVVCNDSLKKCLFDLRVF